MKSMKANFVVMCTPWLMLWHSGSGRLDDRCGRRRVVSSHDVVKAGSCSKDMFPKLNKNSKHIMCIKRKEFTGKQQYGQKL